MRENLIAGLQQIFVQKGYNPVVGTIYQQQEKWINWYRGEVNDFHYFSIKTVGGSSAQVEKASLNMAKKGCEDWTSLLWNEECELKAGTAQEALNDVLADNNFSFEIKTFIEKSFAYGTGVIVEYRANEKTKIQFSYGNYLMPLDFENTTITQMALMQEFNKDKHEYVHVQYHLFEDGIYKIQHEIYEVGQNGILGNQADLSLLFSEEEITAMTHVETDEEGNPYTCYYTEYETLIPHYQIFTPAIANNFELDSPMGISPIANSVSALKGVDDAYHSLNIEDVNTRVRVYVNDEGTKTRKNKETIIVNGQQKTIINSLRYFDKDDTIHQSMVLSEDDPIKFLTPTHQGESRTSSLNTHLNVFGFKFGFGTNFYSFDNGQVYVNKESVTTSNIDLYANRSGNISKLKKVLMRMMYCILFLEQDLGNYNGTLDVEYEVIIDDSMMEDDNEIINRYERAANNGWIPPYVASAKLLKITEEEAKALWEAQDKITAKRNAAFIGQFEPEEDEE